MPDAPGAEGVDIFEAFQTVAERFAARDAVHDLEGSLTYARLAAGARRIAAATRSLPEDAGPLAVVMPFDRRLPIGLMGALAAGRTALPIDPEHPAERNRRIIDHAGVGAAITTHALATPPGSMLAGLPLIGIEDIPPTAAAGSFPPRPGAPAFVIYTSGSTGRPKGVAHGHAGALAATRALGRICEVGPGDRVGVFFAGTMTTIALIEVALVNGAELHVLPAQALGADGLVREIRARGITVLHIVPTLLRRLAEAVGDGERLASVRIVRLMGDRSDWSDVDLARRAFGPQVSIAVGVASTEVPISYAHWMVEDSVRRPGERLPVGRPTPFVDLRLVDEQGREAATGELGEAVASGPCVALGYWREPELTARAFTREGAEAAGRSFATGDMCRRRPDGLIEFVGRKDDLVKLRGHRIEPAEIEAALRACSGVADAAVLTRREPERQAAALVAYVEVRPGSEGLLPRHILAMLAQKLPAYMLPTAIRIGPLPRLPNFKPDRQALDLMEAARAADLSTRREDPLLDEVARVFERVVGCRGATAEDSLLSLGGDSLQAVALTLELERRFGLEIPKAVFRNSRSIAELSAWIARGGIQAKE